MPNEVTRGRLAAETGSNAETIRYYERIGLLPAPKRSNSGYRLYGEGERRRLRFILRGRELGFSIAELHALLGLVDGGNYSCDEIRDLTLRQRDRIEAKIADLERLRDVLTAISRRCPGGKLSDCPIVDSLFGDSKTA